MEARGLSQWGISAEALPRRYTWDTHLLETLFPLSLSTTLDFSMVGKAC